MEYYASIRKDEYPTFVSTWTVLEKTKSRKVCRGSRASSLAKVWKELRCPSTDEWIKKMWSIYTMEYYVSIRKGEYPTSVSTSINRDWRR